LTTSGIVSAHCAAVLPDGLRQVVFTGSDIIVTDGQGAESILEKRWKRWLAANLSSTTYDRSFVVVDRRNSEAWICLPTTGNTLPDKALVWNFRTGGMGQRDLANISFIAPGQVSESITDSWDGDSGTWDSDGSAWNAEVFGPQSASLLAADPTNTKLHQMNATEAFNGVAFTSLLRREGLAFIGRDRNNEPKADITKTKFLRRIYPKISGGAVSIRVGGQDTLGGTVNWAAAQTFTPGTDTYLDFTVTGRLLAVEFSSTAAVSWELEGYDLDVEILGNF